MQIEWFWLHMAINLSYNANRVGLVTHGNTFKL